ncbi:hypothetical protein D5086_002415 [Populus alba]|uniref:Uncharacterized protein n=1 Tax=Populus alba TaxID=43335 RepID=A0ACC4D2S6_POPAL
MTKLGEICKVKRLDSILRLQTLSQKREFPMDDSFSVSVLLSKVFLLGKTTTRQRKFLLLGPKEININSKEKSIAGMSDAPSGKEALKGKYADHSIDELLSLVKTAKKKVQAREQVPG